MSYGIFPMTERMPDACVPGERDPQTPPGSECYAERPLPEGNYRIHARGFFDLLCPEGAADCDCTPVSGSCLTSARFGAGDEVDATVDVQLPVSMATVTFRDE